MTTFRLAAAVTVSLLGATGAAAFPTISGCPSLPADNVWNAKVDTLPVHARSAAWVQNAAIANNGASRHFHMDFGSGLYLGQPIGIPFVVVPGTTPKVPVAFDDEAADESDPGPYAIPPNAPVEGGPNGDGDRHVIAIDKDNCILYEIYSSYPINNGASWEAYSGAIYNLRSNALRPAGWTSADAAGLPIFPGLVRYDEVASGKIEHALRFTVEKTQRAYVWPARHYAAPSTNTDPNLVPMGARFRMKASVNIDGLSPHAKVIAQAMKTYGIINADNGSPWYVSGAPDERWDNDVLHELDFLTGNDFEAVDMSSLMADPNSGRVAGYCVPTADGDADGMPDCVEAAEGRSPFFKDNDVFGNARLFAMQQYRDFLGREGDAGGITFQANAINGGTSRAQVIENFFNSPEFGGIVAPVTRLYFAFFNRIPDYPGLQFQVNAYRAGTPLTVIANNFAVSPEFQATYGNKTNTEYVQLLYANVLGRGASQGEIDFHVNRLTSGVTRGEVMVGFSESPEYRALRFNAVYVTNMYVGMLRRAPEQSGFDFWVDYMTQGNSGLALIAGFLNAPEYRARFLP